MTIRYHSCRDRSRLQGVVDEFAHVAPGELPFGERFASVVGDVVVAPRRSEGRSLDPALQQARWR